jgi:hypothetical protein
MYNKKQLQYYLIYALIVFLAILTSCEYKLKEEYYKDIEVPVPRSTINLNELKDSLCIYDLTDIKYVFQEKGQILKNLNIYLDNTFLYSGQDTIAKFSIDPSKFQTGSHQLIIKYTTSSGSGSLADVSGAEGFSLSKKYVIYIDNDPPSKLSIKSIKVKDGSLLIEWDKPNKPNYKSITLHGRYGGTYYDDKTYPINKEATTFKDTLYTGGKVQYYLQLDGYKYSLNGDPAVFDTVGIDINYVIEDNNSAIRFYWKQPVLYHNLKRIQLDSYGEFGSVIVNDISQGSVIVKKNVSFGYGFSYTARLVGNDWNLYYYLMPQHFIYLGELVANFYNAKLNYEPNNDLYYSVGGNDSTITKDKDLKKFFLYKIDRKTLKVINYNYVGSNSDAYHSFLSVIDSINGYLIFNDYLYQVDLRTLAISNGKSMMNLLKHKNLNYVKVSKNKLLMFSVFSEIVSIVDLSTDNVIYSNSNSSTTNVCAISEDGKYFYDDRAFYGISISKTVTQLLPIALDRVPSVSFLTNEEGKCFVQRKNEGQLEIFDLKTSTVETHSLNNINDFGERNIFCDAYLPDYVGYYSYGRFILYNFKTHQQTPLNLIEKHTTDYFHYCAGRLFNSRGFAYNFNINP